MPAERSSALPLHLAVSAVIGFVVTLIWSATGAGYLWPAWVWMGLGIVVAVHAALRWALPLRPSGMRAVALLGSLSAILAAAHLVIWAMSGGGFFWPLYPSLVTGTATAILALIVFRDDLFRGDRRELTERVDVLTRTRRGALDVQAAELRRIERDLHDGAQHRLAYIAMELGRARAKLAKDPEGADELLAGAHDESKRAMRELRDLVRGIHPSVLTDRGLDAALSGLADRASVPVEIRVDVPERLPPAVETAAYYVVAETLTNIGKHSGASHAEVEVRRDGEHVVLTIGDDGHGGARRVPGSGLEGLAQRVEALDGTLDITSPRGGPTTITAWIPCAS